tara:strand:+ start:917 stop:1600 length:684 start_codon:yes stop_codon:yes gene_type:complete
MSQNIILIYELSKAKKQIQNPKKNASADHGSYRTKYATLEQIMSAVTDILLEHGIVWQQIAHDCETGAKIETVLMGHGGEIYCGPVYVPAERVKPHSFGSAMTYARRYSLALACGVGSDEDNDALLVQEEYNVKELKEDINQNMKKYELWKSPTETSVIIGSENFCKELQHFLKGKTDAEKNAIAEANKVQITDVLLDVAADKSIGETKRNNRIKFLDQVMLNVNPA